MMNKRGELTTAQLVTIIILIVSFIIILFLIFRLNPGEQSNKEICHNSVVLRDKSIGLSGPLDCRTNYLCISGGEDCESFQSSKAEVNLDSKESKDKVMKAIAQEMSDCWYMFGEGKLNYGESQSPTVKYAICSIIEFDGEIQEKYPEINYAEFYDYLAKEKKSDSQNYLSYLYGVNGVNSLEIETQFKVDISLDKINTNEKCSIITGIDDNFTPLPDKILHVYIIPTSETSSRVTANNKEFITKV